MSRRLEKRLQRALGASRASDEVERHAADLALAALAPEPTGGKHRLRLLTLAAITAAAVLVVTAAALATAGALHLSVGSPDHHSLPGKQDVRPLLRVPPGARGVAAVVDHRLWLVTRGGLRIQGLPVQSATLSPHALYVAAGIGDSLVAMAPNGSRAWSHLARGPVVAISWAPDGLRIAYVVRRGERFELRTIEGNGLGDRLLDGRVRAVAPSWRADSLAVGYVGAGGRPVIYDFGHSSHRTEATPQGAVRGLAFAPNDGQFAVFSARSFSIDRPGRPSRIRVPARGTITGIGWSDNQVVVASTAGSKSLLELFRVSSHGRTTRIRGHEVVGRIEALDGSGGRIVVAVARPRSWTRLLTSAGDASEKIGGLLGHVLLELPAGAEIESVSLR